MFRSIPGQLSRNAIRYVPYAAVGKVDEEKMTELLKDLEDSKTVNMCYHVNDPQAALTGTVLVDSRKYHGYNSNK